MYAPFDRSSPLSQGDIVNNVVISYITSIADPAFISKDDDYVDRDLTQPLNPDEELKVLGEALKTPVLVISPSCDIDYGEFISVARIFPFIDRKYDEAGSAKKKANHIRRNYQHVGAQPGLYYLQESPEISFPKSIASFLELHTIRKTDENLAYLVSNRILRLTNEAVGDLQLSFPGD